MGSFDGAEACELVVCYLLHQIKNETGNANIGLYRDDGLGVIHGTAREVEILKKKIIQIFKRNQLKITIEVNKKIVNFLDVTFNLNTEKHRPYLKPNNVPQYVNVNSNHPPSIIKAIPETVNRRLAQISSDESEFNQAKNIYQEALIKSGYNHELKYRKYPEKNKEEENKKRRRRITWFNPPFNANVTTNIGRRFLALVSSCFPKSHPLHKIFNRNTLKISYCCTPNVKNIIDRHNIKQLQKPTEAPKICGGHRKGNTCPLAGECKRTGIVYQAEIKSWKTEGTSNTKTQEKTETYVGMTNSEFIIRFNNHKQDFTKEHLKNRTTLSQHIWKLREEKAEYDIKWRVLDSAPAYNNRSKKCRLCLLEKYYIICHHKKATLNQMRGLLNSCVHTRPFILANHPG